MPHTTGSDAPVLDRVEVGAVAVHTDAALRERHGIVIAFTERTGGASAPPYASLDLAGHVGDDPASVDESRRILLDAIGLGHLRERLTTAEQVHGSEIVAVAADVVGGGARVLAAERPPVPECDGLLTSDPDVPLMLFFADCVPVILVATGPTPAVAVVHAGWRGALARIAGQAATRLAATAGCDPSDLRGYVGPHIGPCHYEVDAERLSRFTNGFGTIAAPQGRLDLGAVVSQSLSEVGVRPEMMVLSDICTAEQTDSFFSFRAEGVTGRHGALAAILGPGR